MAQINTRIILRNDSSINWALNEQVILLKGEVGVEFLSDGVCKIKIGDGVTAWKDLSYFGGEQLLGDDKTIVVNGEVISLKGFEQAAAGSQLRKNADGELEWFVPSNELELRVDGLEGDVSGLQQTVAGLSDDVDKLEKAVEVIPGIQDTLNGLIEGLDPEKIDGVKDLIDYVEKHGTEVQGIIEKLETIEEGSQVNVLESLFVAGEKLDIVDKAVEIPVATMEKHGVVKSATGANKVNVAADGTMRVSKIDVNSLVVPMGEEFVLNGGNSYGSGVTYASSIGNIGYATIEEAIEKADNGDVVALQSDMIMGSQDTDHLAISAENVVIDLNDHNFMANGSNGAIKVEGGMTTLAGHGEVNATLGSDGYSMTVWADAGKVVINDGVYTNATDGSDRGTDLIYVSGTGHVEINGGIFEAATPEWTLNVKDADYKAGKANIIVKGGSFKNFDPSNCKVEGPGTNFVPLGYQSVKEGDYYVVKPL